MLFLLPYALVSCLIFVGMGYWRGSLIISWHILPILLIYPIWGVIQQFLVVALIGGNLYELTEGKLPKWMIIVVTAAIFAAVHFPYNILILGTFILALVYTFLYLKSRNLWALGLYHGWLGAVFFYSLLQRDPWLEIFDKLSL